MIVSKNIGVRMHVFNEQFQAYSQVCTMNTIFGQLLSTRVPDIDYRQEHFAYQVDIYLCTYWTAGLPMHRCKFYRSYRSMKLDSYQTTPNTVSIEPSSMGTLSCKKRESIHMTVPHEARSSLKCISKILFLKRYSKLTQNQTLNYI